MYERKFRHYIAEISLNVTLNHNQQQQQQQRKKIHKTFDLGWKDAFNSIYCRLKKTKLR